MSFIESTDTPRQNGHWNLQEEVPVYTRDRGLSVPEVGHSCRHVHYVRNALHVPSWLAATIVRSFDLQSMLYALPCDLLQLPFEVSVMSGSEADAHPI